jgi:CRP/FNR family transcriptional regulator, cyclic AMP receptor protein
MAVQNRNKEIENTSLFKGLDDSEIAKIASLCNERSYNPGELCQTEGQSTNLVNLIIKGRAGTVVRIQNVTYLNSEIILDVLHEGDVFGWSSLIQGTPWSTLRVLDPMEVLYIDATELLNLCENNNHIGYVLMRRLASLIASRLRRNRMSILNTIVAIRG